VKALTVSEETQASLDGPLGKIANEYGRIWTAVNAGVLALNDKVKFPATDKAIDKMRSTLLQADQCAPPAATQGDLDALVTGPFPREDMGAVMDEVGTYFTDHPETREFIEGQLEALDLPGGLDAFVDACRNTKASSAGCLNLWVVLLQTHVATGDLALYDILDTMADSLMNIRSFKRDDGLRTLRQYVKTAQEDPPEPVAL
jgi:hypothetical protein